MSANTLLPPHRLGVLMSPVGRSLECGTCHLSFDFPDREAFVTIARQVEAQLCRSFIPIPRIEARLTNRTERRRFVIVLYEGQVPMMAACTKCRSKFFAPTTIVHDVIGAEHYLLHKYDLHRCSE